VHLGSKGSAAEHTPQVKVLVCTCSVQCAEIHFLAMIRSIALRANGYRVGGSLQTPRLKVRFGGAGGDSGTPQHARSAKQEAPDGELLYSSARVGLCLVMKWRQAPSCNTPSAQSLPSLLVAL
jgi:hypothetical protein